MKNKIGGVVLLLCFLFIMGCGGSSMPEDVYNLQQLPDFKEVIQSMEISGAWYTGVTVDKATPAIEATGKPMKIYSGHMYIYRTKSDTFRIATIFNSRPPIITGLSKEFK
jgi:hypothetical protein